jgi:hypothetical protein
MSTMQSHIAIHQQRVALFALPNSTGLEKDSDVDSDQADAGHLSEDSNLSENTADLEPTYFFTACQDGDEDGVKTYLSAKPQHLDLMREDEAAPLHIVAEKGFTDIVRLLLMQGAKVDVRDAFGSTPLVRAVSSGHLDVVRELLLYGADPGSMNAAGRMPLDFLYERQDEKSQQIKELLIESASQVPRDAKRGGDLGPKDQTNESSRDDETRPDPQVASTTNDPYEDAVIRATPDSLVASTRKPFLEVCQMVNKNNHSEACPKLVAAMVKRLAVRNTTIQLGTLELANTLSQNMRVSFICKELASRTWTDALLRLVGDSNTDPRVKADVRERMEQWSRMFAGNPDLSMMEDALQRLNTLPLVSDRIALQAEYESKPLPPLPPLTSYLQQTKEITSSNAPTADPNVGFYPWSRWRLPDAANNKPFPRSGAGVNPIASKEGHIYIFGGLLDDSTVRGDLWLLELESRKCYPLATISQGPSPRVGHAALMIGNAFIVFGGDEELDDSDEIDTTLYLLNTSTRQWSRVWTPERRLGRYGHSMCLLGTCLYIFGGQQEGNMYNDTWQFDLNALSSPENKWIKRNPVKMPPVRTNHTAVVYNDEMWMYVLF